MKNPIQMIKQCVEKEEPYFLLRGQDLCALKAIETYYEEVKKHVKDPYFIEERFPGFPGRTGNSYTGLKDGGRQLQDH